MRKSSMYLLRIVSVLLILVLFMSSFITGRFAQYKSSADNEDSARVAKFEIQETGQLKQNLQTLIQPGEVTFNEIQIENKSEVKVACTVEIINQTNNLPLEFMIRDANTGEAVLDEAAGTTVEDGDTTKTDIPDNKVTFTMDIGGTANLNLNTYWDVENALMSDAGKVDVIEIYVTTVQVD